MRFNGPREREGRARLSHETCGLRYSRRGANWYSELEPKGASRKEEQMAETRTDSMVQRIASLQDFALYRDLAWEGTFEDYLQIVRQRPQVTRNAFQRVYDMIISYGTEEYIDNKKKLVRYNFFKDEIEGGADAIFGLDIPLMRLVHVLKAAAE